MQLAKLKYLLKCVQHLERTKSHLSNNTDWNCQWKETKEIEPPVANQWKQLAWACIFACPRQNSYCKVVRSSRRTKYMYRKNASWWLPYAITHSQAECVIGRSPTIKLIDYGITLITSNKTLKSLPQWQGKESSCQAALTVSIGCPTKALVAP